MNAVEAAATKQLSITDGVLSPLEMASPQGPVSCAFMGETAFRVLDAIERATKEGFAGAIAQQMVNRHGIGMHSCVSGLAPAPATSLDNLSAAELATIRSSSI
jgi:hypothetical protein